MRGSRLGGLLAVLIFFTYHEFQNIKLRLGRLLGVLCFSCFKNVTLLESRLGGLLVVLNFFMCHVLKYYNDS